MNQQLLCLGFGFCAKVLARRAAKLGYTISGTSREKDARAQLTSLGYSIFDPQNKNAFADAVGAASHILVSAGPGPQGDPFVTALAKTLATLKHRPDWIGYLSTTGVYGVRDGTWVSEETEASPLHRRGEARLAAEQAWRELGRGFKVPVSLFRLAGIYGPGRNALEQLRKGTAKRLIKPEQVFNRIHVDDIAQVLLASMAMPGADGIYNVADDTPAPPQDVVAYAAKLLGMEPPPEVPFSQAELTPMAASFYLENKRVRNTRIKSRLGVTLAYPDYKSGLEAILAAEQA